MQFDRRAIAATYNYGAGPDRGHHSANIHRQLFLRSPADPRARQSKALSRHELKRAEGCTDASYNCKWKDLLHRDAHR